MATNETDTKRARFDTRITKAQKELFERAARLGGYRNLTDFVVIAVQEKAKEIISENERIIATQRDSQFFFEAIMSAEKPNKELFEAVRDFKSLLN